VYSKERNKNVNDVLKHPLRPSPCQTPAAIAAAAGEGQTTNNAGQPALHTFLLLLLPFQFVTKKNMRPLQRPRLRSLPNAKGASFIISEYTLSSQTGNIRQQGVYVLVTAIKQHGAMLAKGRLLGLQFLALLNGEDGTGSSHVAERSVSSSLVYRVPSSVGLEIYTMPGWAMCSWLASAQ